MGLAVIDHDALLAAVCHSPADDAPRLVMADWFDEHAGDEPCGRCHGDGTVGVTFLYGNPKKPTEPTARLPSGCTTCDGTGRVSNGFAERAEFIRVQCELAKPPACEWMTRGLDCARYNADVQPYRVMVRCPTCQKRDALLRREQILHPQGSKEDVALARLLMPHIERGDPPIRWTYRRGFIESVALTTAEFLGGGPCGRCREEMGDAFDLDCPACGGTGAAAGLAAVLGKAGPLTAIRLADREPLGGLESFGTFPDADSIWYVGPDLIRPSGEVIRNQHHLPPELGRLLTGWRPVTRRVAGGDMFSLEHCRGYPSAAAAQAALSLACLALIARR